MAGLAGCVVPACVCRHAVRVVVWGEMRDSAGTHACAQQMRHQCARCVYACVHACAAEALG
eukprot:303662-Chlamydomonas_euryale.AAC.2